MVEEATLIAGREIVLPVLGDLGVGRAAAVRMR